MSEQIEQQNNKVQPTTEETTVVTEQVAGFQVVNEGFSTREAIEEAKRCLHCKVPQCKKGCPIGNDIPDFVHELSMGNMGAAMSIINAKSNLPAICGRVCPHEKQCQGNCVLGKKGKPVQIGKLEQFVADFDTSMNLSRESFHRRLVDVWLSSVQVLPDLLLLVIWHVRALMSRSSKDRPSLVVC